MSNSAKAFTLIEIMVVVVLLGILAAIVVPQLSGASDQARQVAFRNDIRLVRTQIELYKLQHNGMYPGYAIQGDGSLTEWSGERFVLQLVGTTDPEGNLGGTGCGPYLERFPTNSYASDPDDAASVKEGLPDGDDTGWVFDPAANGFHANDADIDHQQW